MEPPETATPQSRMEELLREIVLTHLASGPMSPAKMKHAQELIGAVGNLTLVLNKLQTTVPGSPMDLPEPGGAFGATSLLGPPTVFAGAPAAEQFGTTMMKELVKGLSSLGAGRARPASDIHDLTAALARAKEANLDEDTIAKLKERLEAALTEMSPTPIAVPVPVVS
jgi:hypothetical protein